MSVQMTIGECDAALTRLRAEYVAAVDADQLSLAATRWIELHDLTGPAPDPAAAAPTVAVRNWQCHACHFEFESPHASGRLPTVCPECRRAGHRPRPSGSQRRIDETSPGYLLAREVTELRCAFNLIRACIATGRWAEATAACDSLRPRLDRPRFPPGSPAPFQLLEQDVDALHQALHVLRGQIRTGRRAVADATCGFVEGLPLRGDLIPSQRRYNTTPTLRAC